MIIQCDKCLSKFNLDETILKPEGSKVRCSLCKHVFMAYSPNRGMEEETETIAVSRDQLAGTMAQDFGIAPQGEEAYSEGEDRKIGFDRAFDDNLENMGEASTGDFDDRESEEAMAEEPPPVQAQAVDVPSKTSAPLEHEKQPEEKGETTEAAPASGRPSKRRLLPVLLAIVCLLLAAAVGIILWAPALIPDSLTVLKPIERQEVVDLGVRRLSFKEVAGSFVESKDAGSLFVIRGTVKNDYTKTRSLILIKGNTLDDLGQLIKSNATYAGNTLSEEQVKSRPLEEISEIMQNRVDVDGKNLSMAPGTTLPFVIVFENLPDNLSEFSVEAVSSSPGS